MILTRNSFFRLLFCFMVLPFPVIKLVWIAGTSTTPGTMYFVGPGNLMSVLGISTYPVIRFKNGNDTIVFNANVNIPLEPGEKVSVRFRKNNPGDAKLNMFSSTWGDTLAYDFAPFLVFMIIFLHPDLVPRKAKIVLGGRSWIRMLEVH